MILDVLVRDGGRIYPLRLSATQVVVRQDNDTPIAVAAEYGPERAQAVAQVGDPDFNRILRALGVRQDVVCDVISLPQPPPGARLIAGPHPGA